MSYDSETMAKIAEELYEVHVERVYGKTGVERLRSVIKTVKELYCHRSPQSFSEGLMVFATLDEKGEPLDPGGSTVLNGVGDVAQLMPGAIVQVVGDGRLRAWPPATAESEDLVSSAVVYVFFAARERSAQFEAIALPAGLRTVPNPNGYPSALAPPTFWNLEDALDYYAANLAARSTCERLREVWALDADDRRLVLRNCPEQVMRESLARHLRSSVRDAKLVRVNEEQNVSETEPIDIQIVWSLTTHIALVEIKWMGKCLNEGGDGLASYTHSDGRAREGVGQLANYIDLAYERSPKHEIVGYLVVFDARRRRVTRWEPGPISKEDAWHYARVEIDFRDSIPDRRDIQPPRRVFLEPRIAA